MDINELRATVTLIGLMLFVWLVLHTWSRRRKADHDEAANLPFAGEALGACRTWGVDSENRPQRGQFLPDLQPHSPAMGQKDGEKWTAAVDSQPTIPKSDRLLDRAAPSAPKASKGTSA